MQENKIKILIVDDSLIARMGVKKMLIDRNYIFEEASNGLEALEKFEVFLPDLMIMDYLMPEMNGMLALKILRGRGCNVPVIIISANQQDATKTKFMELSISGMLKKHPDKDQLLSLLDSIFPDKYGEKYEFDII